MKRVSDTATLEIIRKPTSKGSSDGFATFEPGPNVEVRLSKGGHYSAEQVAIVLRAAGISVVEVE